MSNPFLDITRALEIQRAQLAAAHVTPVFTIEDIAAALRIAAMGGRELWRCEEIAAYAKLKRNYVANVIIAQPGFPTPIRAIEKGKPRYVACEVMAWFEARRG